jgi:hypothetical protein
VSPREAGAAVAGAGAAVVAAGAAVPTVLWQLYLSSPLLRLRFCKYGNSHSVISSAIFTVIQGQRRVARIVIYSIGRSEDTFAQRFLLSASLLEDCFSDIIPASGIVFSITAAAKVFPTEAVLLTSPAATA